MTAAAPCHLQIQRRAPAFLSYATHNNYFGVRTARAHTSIRDAATGRTMKATIVRKQRLTPEIHRYRLSAPQIAAAHKPAQYVSLRPIPLGDRICLTVTDANPENGWIDVVFHTGSKPASIFTGLREGDTVLDIVGPQGNPAPVRKYGNCLCVCSETGIAPLYPIIASLVKLKNRVTAVVDAHTKTDLILAD